MAETVTTELFTVEVPDGWTVENDEVAIVIAGGNRIVDRMPMPFLSIQACAEGFDSSPCKAPCSQDALSFSQARGMTFSPVTRRVAPSGVVELRARGAVPPDFVAFVALSCTSQAQVYVSLASDESVEQAERVFEAVLASIKLMPCCSARRH